MAPVFPVARRTRCEVEGRRGCPGGAGGTAPQAHPLAALAEVTAADLAGHAFVELARGHSMWRRVDTLSAGVDREIVVEAATALAAVELAREGVGVTLCSLRFRF